MMRISIIVPVYNGEEALNRCLESLHRQPTIDDSLQFVIVNDGSTDGSDRIIDNYCQKDHRLVKLSTPNKGVAHARNCGIKHSSGDYVCFLDCDDEVKENYFEALESELKRSAVDVLLFTAQYSYDNIHYQIYNSFSHCNRNMSGIQFASSYIKQHHFLDVVPWTKAVKKELLTNNKLYFPDTYGEDEVWSHKLFVYAKKVRYVNKIIYVQHRTSHSLSSYKNEPENIASQKNSFIELEHFYHDHLDEGNLSKQLYSELSHDYIGLCCRNDTLKIKFSDKLFCLKNAHTFSRFIDALLFFISPQLRKQLKCLAKK